MTTPEKNQKAQASNEHPAELPSSENEKATLDLENQYEHKLALELERFDDLSEEIESIQQRCESLLQAQTKEHEAAIRDAEGRTKRVEKELRQQIERLYKDAKHNEQMFREVLDQQEHEYETELQQLMAAAQAELAIERECTAEARGLIQARNTKISRLDKRLDALKTASHARTVLLTAEKVRNAKLEATLRHFKRHMEERESTLEAKELSILNLRRKNVTLDNFRFVLDHRVQQLVEERGPITRHVEGLETHITAMYDELEADYYEKKKKRQLLNSKDSKIMSLGQGTATLRGLLRERDAYIASFKRMLSTLVEFTTPKDLEGAVKNAYFKYIRDEESQDRLKAVKPYLSGQEYECGNSFEEHQGFRQAHARGLSNALVEAHSQRIRAQKATENSKHRLCVERDNAQRLQRARLGENSLLIAECNLRRGESLSLARDVNHLRQVVKDHDEKKRREGPQSQRIAQYHVPRTHGKSQITFGPSPALYAADLPLESSESKGLPKRESDRDLKAPIWPQTLKRLYRGSTRALSLLSDRDAQIVQMESAHDANTRLIETQKMEIRRLRKTVAKGA